MSSLFRKYVYLTAAAVLAFASASFAQTTSMDLTATGNNTIVWGQSFGVYVDPYTATVGNQTGLAVICDDWSDDTNVGEMWTASVTSVSSLTATPTNPPLFQSLAAGNNPTASPQSLNQAQLYDELVYLSTNMLNAVNGNNVNGQIVASFTMWELTYGAVGSNGGPSNPAGNPSTFLAGATNYSGSALQSAVNSLLTSAQNALNAPGGINTANWEILTPSPESLSEPQEFLVYTPESSAVIMFSADMLGLLALAFAFRKRLVLPIS